MSQPDPQQQAVRTAAQPVAKLGGGQLLAAISNAFVSMLRELYGRGPMKAKTYAWTTSSSSCCATAATARSRRR